MEERLAQAGFKSLNRLAHSAWRHAQVVGGFAKAPVLRDRNEFGQSGEGIVARHARALEEAGLVEPSAFRTEFLSEHSIRWGASNLRDYAGTAGASRKRLAAMAGRQPGDPARAAAAIIQAVDSPKPPLHLVLGADAYHRTRQMLDAFSTDLETWKDVAIGADYDA